MDRTGLTENSSDAAVPVDDVVRRLADAQRSCHTDKDIVTGASESRLGHRLALQDHESEAKVRKQEN